MRGCIIALALSLATQSARADDNTPKDPDTALALSIGMPLASIAVIAGGGVLAGESHGHAGQDVGVGAVYLGVAAFQVAPSAGEWYAGSYFTPGLGLRIAGLVLLGAGVATYGLNIDCADFDCPPQHNGGSTTLLLLGGASYVGGFAWDIASARSTARRYNHAHRVVSVPVAAPHTVGLGFAGSF